MQELDEVEDELIKTVESDVDAWESFYKKYKGDYAKIAQYEKKIERLEEEIKKRDNRVSQKLKNERGTLLLYTLAYLLASGLVLKLVSASLDFWLHLSGGFLIGVGLFGLLYLWIR